jgi:hypothetical protein
MITVAHMPACRYMTVEFKDLSLAPAVSASGTLQGMTAKEELERWWNHNLVQLANSYRQHVGLASSAQLLFAGLD